MEAALQVDPINMFQNVTVLPLMGEVRRGVN
jgi:hypothetical protein